MNSILPLLGLCVFLSSTVFAKNDTIVINKDLTIVQLSEHSFVHISYYTSEKWG